MMPAVRLGEVLRHRKEFVAIDDIQTYKRPRVRLHAQGVVLRDEVRGAEIKTKKQQVCRAGEFLVAEIDAKVGGFGIVPPELDGAIVSSHYFLFVVNEDGLDQRFLDWFARTPAFREQVEAQGSTNYAAIRPRDVLQYQVPLPPLPEQRRIVARIEEVAEKVAEAKRLRLQATEYARLLWKGQARALLGTVPQEFWNPVRDVVEIGGGGTPSKLNPAFWTGSIPWVSPKDMKNRELTDTADHITEAGLSGSTAKLHQPGSVLVVVRGMILARTFPSAVLRVPAAINQDMKALKAKSGLLPEYLCSVLAALNDDILALVERSTHDTRKLLTATLEAFRIPVPAVEEQHRLLKILNDLEMATQSLLVVQGQTATELDALLPSILDKAFKGEL